MRIGDELRAPVNGIEIAYQEIGDPDGEPMVMIMGLATQMIHWDLGFCELLADAGFRVIRFDNRDIGHSTWIDAPAPGMPAMLLGLRRDLAYTLEDMATDVAGLIEHLELGSAHVVGASQGGMIAQVLAYSHPRLVRSLGLIMTGAGKRIASVPRLRALGSLLSRPPRDRDGYIERVVKTFAVIGSPDYPPDLERLHQLVGEGYDRGHNPAGAARQLHAVTAAGDRTRRLRSVTVPAVVIHGTRDPLVRPVAGRGLAAALPNARLEMIEGMGHDLPPELWGRIAGYLIENAHRARRAPVASPAGQE
jgi:pimeloyl-ACP methyl ester carboxylesterase